MVEPLTRRGLSRRFAPVAFVSLMTACLPLEAAPPAPLVVAPPPPTEISPSAHAEPDRAVVLIVIDGVRVTEAFDAMPHLRAIAGTSSSPRGGASNPARRSSTRTK